MVTCNKYEFRVKYMSLFSEHYVNENTLSGVDARIKIFTAFAIMIMILSYKGFLFPLFVTLICLVILNRIRVPFKLFILRFSESVFIALVIILLKMFFSGGHQLFSISLAGLNIVVYKDGLIEGLLIGCRIMSAVSVVTVLTFTAPFAELMAGLSWFRIPRDFIEISIFAYRYIFVLLDEAAVTYNSQKNRLGYSSIRRGLNSFGILAGSITIKAFEHSQNTTAAMVQRGYDGNIPVLNRKPFKLSEIAASAMLVMAMWLIWIA